MTPHHKAPLIKDKKARKRAIENRQRNEAPPAPMGVGHRGGGRDGPRDNTRQRPTRGDMPTHGRNERLFFSGWALQGGRANFARPPASLRPPWQTPAFRNPYMPTR